MVIMRFLGLKKQTKLSISCHLADHCNLKCKGCDNYSCIAQKKYADFETFEKDLKRLKEIFINNVENIYLLGGEPLLNKNVEDFMSCARNIFNNTNIHLVSNGILFENMPESFWKCAKLNNISIEYTEYPIKYNKSFLNIVKSKYDVEIKRFGHENDALKTLQFIPFDLSGKQDIIENYKKCFHANKCIQLREGKIYTCNIRAYADLFCDKFGVNMHFSNEDYIEIYQDITQDEIFEFLSKPIPFCRYCNIKGRRNNHIWRTISDNYSIYDWANFELDNQGIEYLNKKGNVCFVVDKIDKNILFDSNNENIKFKWIIIPVDDLDTFEAFDKDIQYVVCVSRDDLLYDVESKLVEKNANNILYMKTSN